MKHYLTTVVVTAALFISASFIGQKLQAQKPTPQTVNETAATGSPTFVTEIPPGYRDWKLISVAREEGELDDIRAVLGNDVAIKAYREGKLPFPDGAIIARIAWSY